MLSFLFVDVIAEEKSSSSEEGLEDAEKDIAAFKEKLKKKNPEELIGAFIVKKKNSSRQRYGGYEYFYNYMANIAIYNELMERKEKARDALEAHVDDKAKVYEAINGPSNSVGELCRELLEKLKREKHN